MSPFAISSRVAAFSSLPAALVATSFSLVDCRSRREKRRTNRAAETNFGRC
jgi:hypothetical protein